MRCLYIIPIHPPTCYNHLSAYYFCLFSTYCTDLPYLPTYVLPACIRTWINLYYLSTCLPAYLPAYYLPTFVLRVYLHAYLPTYVFICLPAYLCNTCLPVHLATDRRIYEGESVNKSQMVIKSKSVIFNLEETFISRHIFHQHWYTCPVAFPVRRNPQHRSLLTVGLWRILTMVYAVQNYKVYFGIYPLSGVYKTKITTFRRLDLSPSSGGWGKIDLPSWAR
jgi:hypothetical protein